MRLDEYAQYDALGLAELISTKQLTITEVAQLAAEAIALTNQDVNAVIEVYPDRIENLSDDMLADGPFKGVPYVIKDVTGHLKGRKIEFGSRLCEGMICQQDSHYGQMLKKSGLNIIGRSNTPEYSLAGTTENALYGNTSTPWRKGYSAGGSSGGGAAAVAAGMVPISDGSDIGGSIRIPASLCGVVGLKPSRGRVSMGPLREEGGYGLAMMFGQHKSIRDVATYLDCLSQPQPGDPYIIPKPDQTYSSFITKPSADLKIGFSTAPLMNAPVDPEVTNTVEKVARTLSDMGHHVTEESPVFDHEAASVKLLDVWFAGFDKTLEGYANQLGRTIGLHTLEPVTLKVYEYSKSVDLQRFLDALRFINESRRKISEYFVKYDIWLSPTTAQVAEPHGRYNQGLENLSAEDYIRHTDRPIQFTFPHNLMGTPAISLPLGMHSNGLPIGVQLGAGPANEHILIQLSTMLETALPWYDRVPPLHISSKV